MDSNDVNSSPKPSESPETVVISEIAPTQEPASDSTVTADTEAAKPVQTAAQSNKKSPKALIFAGSLVLVLLVAASVVYLLHATAGRKTADDAKVNSSATTSLNSAVDDTSNTITNSAASETSLTGTDDSGAASDATNSAATVGDSIDENSF